jgi:polyphosphate kinase 2 (PPK2 family)
VHDARPFERIAPIMGRLDEVDLSQKLSASAERLALEQAQDRLLALRLQLGGQLGGGLGPPLCILFEGWDAAGKGGAIKRLVARLDPRHVSVHQFAAPTEREKRHHFLWRFQPSIPGWGGMTVLDRSWYGRVLVERVEGYATPDQWRRAYDAIVNFERGLVEDGMILIKFWLHISKDEQLKRFKRREKDPLKRWKLTDEDWRNREKWDEYVVAVEDMFRHTDHALARWHIIPANSKRFARVAVLNETIQAVEAGMRQHGIEPIDMAGKDDE